MVIRSSTYIKMLICFEPGYTFAAITSSVVFEFIYFQVSN